MKSFRTHPIIMGIHFLFLVPFIPAAIPILRDSSFAHILVYICGIFIVLFFIIYGNLKPVVRLMDKGIKLTNYYPSFRDYGDLRGYETRGKTGVFLHFRSFRIVRLHLKNVDRESFISGLEYHGVEILG